jgi:shikimate dehydrogenase
MNRYGLIGFPLSHSFSKHYFTAKFEKEGIPAVYELYEMKQVNTLPELLRQEPELKGLNVTIPHKQAVIPLLTDLDPVAARIGAVNVIKVGADGGLIGFNSDYYGFRTSLEQWLLRLPLQKALVLGSGGASRAVSTVLEDLKIGMQLVSRNPILDSLSYEDLHEALFTKVQLIINTTPLGMYPQVNACPPLPYHLAHAGQLFYDLVYNPTQTLFLQKAASAGAAVQGGLDMLYRQAEKAWEIWTSEDL